MLQVKRVWRQARAKRPWLALLCPHCLAPTWQLERAVPLARSGCAFAARRRWASMARRRSMRKSLSTSACAALAAPQTAASSAASSTRRRGTRNLQRARKSFTSHEGARNTTRLSLRTLRWRWASSRKNSASSSPSTPTSLSTSGSRKAVPSTPRGARQIGKPSGAVCCSRTSRRPSYTLAASGCLASSGGGQRHDWPAGQLLGECQTQGRGRHG